jgi:hypothetical protein
VAALLVIILTSTSYAQEARSFRFNDGAFVEPPLSFNFQRPAQAMGRDGTMLAPGQPRYRDTMLLTPLPRVTTVPGTVGEPAISIIAAGEAADGVTPVWVVAVLSKAKLQIHVGDLPGTLYEVAMPYIPGKGSQTDALFESIDAQPGEAWRPISGTICHGVIILQCNVAVPGPNGWVSNRVGFMTCNIADLGGPKNRWWRRHAVSDALSPRLEGVGMGISWSLQSWWSTERTGIAPTSAWIAATDYHGAPAKDGGAYFLFRMQRPTTTSSAWTLDPVVELPGRWYDPTNRSHSHTIGITRYGANGIAAIGSRGDSLGNAAVYAWTIADENLYSLASIPSIGGYNWRRAGPLWIGPQLVHGNIDPSLSDAQVRYSGNQFVGLAPGPTTGTFIVGADEVTEALWTTGPFDINALGLVSPLGFTNTWLLSQTKPILPAGEGPWRHYLCFHIKTHRPHALNGEYVAQFSPSQNDMDSWHNQRIIYSPDGAHWAHVSAHQENMQTVPWIAGDRIWIGSYGKQLGRGVRSIAIPDLISARPLVVAPGGKNAAVAAPEFSDLGIGVSAVANPPLPPTVSPPPSMGPWYHIINQPITTSIASPALGRYRLAIAIPAATREATIRAWIRCDTPHEIGRAQSTTLMASLRSSDAHGSAGSIRTSGTTCSIAISSAGQWVPIVMTTNLPDWAATNTWGPDGGRLDLVLTNAWNVASPASFYIAIESVSLDSTPTYTAPVASNQPSELAEITGLNASDAWTAFIAAKVPDASWDNSYPSILYGDSPPHERPIFSIISQTGQSWIDVTADRTQGAVMIRPGGTAGGNHEQITGFNWWPGSPILLSVAHCPEHNGFILRGSVGGGDMKTSFPVYGLLDSPAAKIRFGSGDGVVSDLEIFGGAFSPGEATTEEVREVFERLPMLRGESLLSFTGDCTDMEVKECTADFDGSGFIDTEDFDQFVRAFEAGEDIADYDHSGFVDTDDFDGFIRAFEAGC